LFEGEELAGESGQTCERRSIGEHTTANGIFGGRRLGHIAIDSAAALRLDESLMKCQ